jgi:ParB/RepB/Spo0J family partition protein
MPMLPIDSLHTVQDLRHVKPSKAEDDALRSSLGVFGILQPVLVRPNHAGGYEVICGNRRVRLARELGFAEVPARVERMGDVEADAARAAENMVRADMAPIDTWRAMVRLVESGNYTPASAAGALGLSEHQARRLDKLGRLHPQVLALIEKFGMPQAHNLATIANAPREKQAAAVKAKGKPQKDWAGRPPFIPWPEIARLCEVERISKSVAIFDAEKSGLAWEEDLFARLGDKDAIYTTDIAGFIKRQEEALQAQLFEAKGKKLLLSTWDGSSSGVELSAGFKRTYGDPDKPARGQSVFCAVGPDGRVHKVVAVSVKEERAKAQAERAKTRQKASAGGAADEAEAGMSQRARTFILAKKTEALRAHLRGEGPNLPLGTLAGLLLLAIASHNVEIKGEFGQPYRVTDVGDLAVRLVDPAGRFGTDDALPDLLAQAIARIALIDRMEPAELRYWGHRTAVNPPEWIGAAIGADAALPRFDTEEFLAMLGGDDLRALAAKAGIRPTMKVGELKRELVGKLPAWRPTTFGAPGQQPKAEKRKRDREVAEDVVEA